MQKDRFEGFTMMIDIDKGSYVDSELESEIVDEKRGLYKGMYDGRRQVRTADGSTLANIFKLSADELEKFRKLGVRLNEYEKEIKEEVNGVYTYAKKRLDDPKDIVRDFDITIKLYFYLDENDPVYTDYNSDNIMSILQMTKHATEDAHPDWKWGCCDANDHNTIPLQQGTVLEHDRHSATFHALYDHSDLSYKEILRIGSFELDVILHLEYNNTNIY